MVDGLKPGQRKILFCCFKRNIRKDVKAGSLIRTCYLKGLPQEQAADRSLYRIHACCIFVLHIVLVHGHPPGYLGPGKMAETANHFGRARLPGGCVSDELLGHAQVAQLSGFVSADTAYHHGETSLQSTIIGLAHNFIGSNNVNVLVPAGKACSHIQTTSKSLINLTQHE